MTAVTEIRLPQFGMGMQEGTIIAWFKREGDHVAAGEVVAEIEAEKVTEELVATGDGVLQRILVPEGDTAAVNELLAVIVPAGAVEPDVADDEPDAVEDERGAVAATDPVADRRDPVPTGPGAGPAGRSHREPGDWLRISASTSTRWSAPAPAPASPRTMSPRLQPETPPPPRRRASTRRLLSSGRQAPVEPLDPGFRPSPE